MKHHDHGAKRHTLIFLGLLAVFGIMWVVDTYGTSINFRAWWPILLMLTCPLMHLFHGNRQGHGAGGDCFGGHAHGHASGKDVVKGMK